MRSIYLLDIQVPFRITGSLRRANFFIPPADYELGGLTGVKESALLINPAGD